MTLADVVRWLEQAPPGTTVPATAMLELLRDADAETAPAIAPDPANAAPLSIWTCDPELRFGVKELASAIGRSASWIYHRTQEGVADRDRLPHKRQDATLIFVAGEVRAYLLEHEQRIVKPTTPVVPITRSRRR